MVNNSPVVLGHPLPDKKENEVVIDTNEFWEIATRGDVRLSKKKEVKKDNYDYKADTWKR